MSCMRPGHAHGCGCKGKVTGFTISEIRGKVIKVVGCAGTRWMVLDYPISENMTIKLLTIPSGNIVEESYNKFRENFISGRIVVDQEAPCLQPFC